MTAYNYLDALLAAIPHDHVPPDIASKPWRTEFRPHPYPKFIDTALRLASGGPAHPDEDAPLRDAWPEIQTSFQHALHALHPSSSKQPLKRKPSPIPLTSDKNKKPKYEQDGGVGQGQGQGQGQVGDVDANLDNGDDDDVPHLTLHALSATAPVRHKVDITLHAHTLRLSHSATGAPTARCALTTLTRAFLLPTRARSSGALQWTALLLAGDKPALPAPRGKASRAAGAVSASSSTSTSNNKGPARFELACSVPDTSSTAVPRMTVHTPTSASASPSHPASAREALLALLSSTISGTAVSVATVERGSPLAGITAFRGVRETSLWFFDGARAGVLTDSRPAEFWAVADLARGETGVRVRTATGRTCSVVLTRRGNAGENDEEEVDEGEEEGEGEETEFQMIDGKERERILEWVRRHRDAFGVAKIQGEGEAVAPETETKVGGTDGRDFGVRGDSDSDSDFEGSSGEGDGGSSSSSSGSGSDPNPGSGSDVDSGDRESDREGGSESEGEGEVGELDPKHHPLLRAGALPKMSRAAMDVAVGLVVDDLVGQAHGGQSEPHSGSRSPAARGEHGHDDEGDDEEDELDD